MPFPDPEHAPAEWSPWRRRLHEIIFEADTRAGKLFDVLLLIAIAVSVLAVMLDSVASIHEEYEGALLVAEWTFTILFTIEYVLRLICVRKPLRYIFSFYGIVDLLAILPTYLGLALPSDAGGRQSRSLLIVRALRLLRIFRVFKLAQFLSEASSLRQAIANSRAKITVFLSVVLISVCLMGAAMHLVEGGRNDGFESIPAGMYWAIVTMTTVGYGDIAPVTIPGKILASVMMMMGYSLIIVPTSIISAELVSKSRSKISTQVCASCQKEGHDSDATFCKFCGTRLH